MENMQALPRESSHRGTRRLHNRPDLLPAPAPKRMLAAKFLASHGGGCEPWYQSQIPTAPPLTPELLETSDQQNAPIIGMSLDAPLTSKVIRSEAVWLSMRYLTGKPHEALQILDRNYKAIFACKPVSQSKEEFLIDNFFERGYAWLIPSMLCALNSEVNLSRLSALAQHCGILKPSTDQIKYPHLCNPTSYPQIMAILTRITRQVGSSRSPEDIKKLVSLFKSFRSSDMTRIGQEELISLLNSTYEILKSDAEVFYDLLEAIKSLVSQPQNPSFMRKVCELGNEGVISSVILHLDSPINDSICIRSGRSPLNALTTPILDAKKLEAALNAHLKKGKAGISCLLRLATIYGLEDLVRRIISDYQIDISSHEYRDIVEGVIMANRFKIMQILIESGVSLNGCLGLSNQTPIQFAIENGRDDLALKLIQIYGKGPNSQINLKRIDNLQRTTLHYAAIYGCDKIVRALVELGADVHAKDAQNRLPIWWANEQKHYDIGKMLNEIDLRSLS